MVMPYSVDRRFHFENNFPVLFKVTMYTNDDIDTFLKKIIEIQNKVSQNGK